MQRRLVLWIVFGVVAAALLLGIALAAIFVYQLVTGPSLIT